MTDTNWGGWYGPSQVIIFQSKRNDNFLVIRPTSETFLKFIFSEVLLRHIYLKCRFSEIVIPASGNNFVAHSLLINRDGREPSTVHILLVVFIFIFLRE